MKKAAYLLFLLAIASCSKQAAQSPDVQNGDGQAIQFSISDEVGMKSSVESLSDLIYNASTNPNAHVYIWATKENADLKKEVAESDPVTYEYNYCNQELFFNSALGLWDITGTKRSWEVGSDSNHSGYTYNFSAYAVRGTDPVTVENTTSANFGKSFSITLPETYSDNCGTDFLLSNVASVTTSWNGSAARGKVVNFHMEHALASVRVKVVANADIYKIGIQGIQIKDFYRGATMQCTRQATYGSGKTNQWSRSNPTYNTTNYIIGDVTRGSGNTRNTIAKCTGTGMIMSKTDASHERILLDFIAIPQDPSATVLTIACLVQEQDGSSEHQVVSSWNLNNYSDWESGYRNVYTITIDTSNSLYATVDDWDTGNSVTGIVLP